MALYYINRFHLYSSSLKGASAVRPGAELQERGGATDESKWCGESAQRVAQFGMGGWPWLAAWVAALCAAPACAQQSAPVADQAFSTDKVVFYMVIGVLALLVSYMTSAVLIIRYTEGIWRLPLGVGSCRSLGWASLQACQRGCIVAGGALAICRVVLSHRGHPGRCCCCRPRQHLYSDLPEQWDSVGKEYKRVNLEMNASFTHQYTTFTGLPTSDV